MCGIYWLLHTKNFTEYTDNNIKKHFEKGSGRGPDYSVLKQKYNSYIGFHRLSINDLTEKGNQPFEINSCVLVCNGEIYNHKELIDEYNLDVKSESDCEVIIHLYKKFGISKTINLLDGVFAFVLYDIEQQTLMVARDFFGVRPLFISHNDETLEISSELKMCSIDQSKCIQFNPGKCMIFNIVDSKILKTSCFSYYNLNLKTPITKNIYQKVYEYLNESVKKRVDNTERPLGCLLSGGLDSSIIASLVKKNLNHNQNLKTFSIGLENSVDIHFSRIMAKYLDSDHSEFIVTEEEMLSCIPEVIHTIESYDTTTVRASVGNWLVGKKIKETSDCKVIFNGDGADEVAGGYLYFREAPNNEEFDLECKRLLSHIHYFDVLRSDRCVSCHGLEARTPFLDRSFVEMYLRINMDERVSKNKQDKHIFRKTFKDILPQEILERKKEAFSDGVSSKQNSWYEIIQKHTKNKKIINYNNNNPKTPEQSYYRSLFSLYYKNSSHIIPYFWMPKFIEAEDSSARTLKIYD